MAEQCFCKAKVPGSSPGGGSKIKLFSGEKDFAKPRLISDFAFCPRGGGRGEESARVLVFIFSKNGNGQV